MEEAEKEKLDHAKREGIGGLLQPLGDPRVVEGIRTSIYTHIGLQYEQLLDVYLKFFKMLSFSVYKLILNCCNPFQDIG